MAVELYINGQRCDLAKREAVALSYAVNRLTDIESRQGSYSNTFKLPKTNVNRALFGHPEEVNDLSPIRYQRLPAEVWVNGIPVVIGTAQLKVVADSIEAVVKWGNSDWIQDLQGKTLRDLDMSDIDHIPTTAHVQANRFNDGDDDYVYPDIDYGNQLWVNGSIPSWWLRPSLFMRKLVSRIFTQAGWTILSNDVDTNQTFREIILPYIDEQAEHTDAWVTSKLFKAQVEPQSLTASFPTSKVYAVGFDTEDFDNGAQFTTGAWSFTNYPTLPTNAAKYTPNEEIMQNFKLHLEFDVTNWSPPLAFIQIQFIRSAYGVRFYDNPFTLAVSGVFSVGGVQAYRHTDALGNGSFVVDIETGMMRGCEFQGVNIHIYGCDMDITSGYLENEVSAERLPLSKRDMALAAPQIDQLQVVKYFVNAFSLIIDADGVNRTVRFTRLDSVPTREQMDWSAKVDWSETPSHTFEVGKFKRTNLLTYETDKDDSELAKYPELGWHEINNAFLPDGLNNIYKAPFALTQRRAVHSGTKELALIDINGPSNGERGLKYIQLTVTEIEASTGKVTVTGGAFQLIEDMKVAYFGSTMQTYEGYDIDRQTFTVLSIESDTVFYLSEIIVGTPFTLSGTIYAGAWDRFLTVDDVSQFPEGSEVVVRGIAGTVTVNGQPVNGRLLRVVSANGYTLELDEVITSASMPDTSAAQIVGCEKWNAPRKTPPRVAVHRNVVNSNWPITLIGEATETDGSEVYDSFIHWDTLAAAHWVTITGIIAKPHMVRLLMRLNASDINQLDFTRPVWLDRFGAYFFLSFVDQYRVDRPSSTEIELVKLPA